MCLYLPNWLIQRRLAGRPEGERALIVHAGPGRGKPQVVACSHAARKRGVLPGMSLAEAQSLWPAAAGRAVRFEEHDPQADRQGLLDLARWCQQQISPRVALDPGEAPDCLLLDATGCGEERFAEEAMAALAKHGVRAQAVIAGTIGTAWALAHFSLGDGLCAVPSGSEKNALRPLPIEALRLTASIVETLHELRVVRIGQLLALPRSQLPSRFGIEILRQIDRALGSVAEVLNFEPLVEPLVGSWEFESPAADGQVLNAAIEYLLDQLLTKVPTEQFGIQQLQCTLKPVDDPPVVIAIELLRPSARKRDLLELVALRIEQLRLGGEVGRVSVEAVSVRPLVLLQDELFGGGPAGAWRQEVNSLLERLGNRLGDKAVLLPVLQPEHQPEYACRYEPWLQAARSRPSPVVNDAMESALCRPAFLRAEPTLIGAMSLMLDGSPLQFEWHGGLYLVEQAWGPERIETGWWRGADVRRDYYLIETSRGERFWMFRNLLDESWYLHGIFA